MTLALGRPLLACRLTTCKHATRAFAACARHREKLQLAYDLHEPPKSNDRQHCGNPIVFVHGLFGNKKNNRSASKILARDLNRPVYAIDLRNHGDSPHSSQHDYFSLAEDVENFLEEHQLDKPTLIGHSMGAKAVMTVALKSPDKVANLIPVDNAPVDAALKSDFGKYAQGMRKIEETKVQKQSEADEILKDYEESLAIRQFLLTNLVRATDDSGKSYQKFRIPVKTLAASLDHMADFPFKDPEEARFEKPTLFIRGTESRYVADDVFPVIGKFFPTFEVRDIKAGHWVISENPMAFKDAVEEWLADKV